MRAQLIVGEQMSAVTPYRISGHESFTCRYTWLPKVVRHLKDDERLFGNEEKAMVQLGVGKNMVRSIHFWAQSADIVISKGKEAGYRLTPFATLLIGGAGV